MTRLRNKFQQPIFIGEEFAYVVETLDPMSKKIKEDVTLVKICVDTAREIKIAAEGQIDIVVINPTDEDDGILLDQTRKPGSTYLKLKDGTTNLPDALELAVRKLEEHSDIQDVRIENIEIELKDVKRRLELAQQVKEQYSKQIKRYSNKELSFSDLEGRDITFEIKDVNTVLTDKETMDSVKFATEKEVREEESADDPKEVTIKRKKR